MRKYNLFTFSDLTLKGTGRFLVECRGYGLVEHGWLHVGFVPASAIASAGKFEVVISFILARHREAEQSSINPVILPATTKGLVCKIWNNTQDFFGKLSLFTGGERCTDPVPF